MKLLDGFSGYGGFRLGLQRAGMVFDEVYFSEIDKYAVANYNYNFPNSNYVGSIKDVSGRDLPNIDLFTFGWPCQDNSIAGKRKGQRSDTRSGLLYESVRLIDETKPRNFIAENVAGLLSVNAGIDIVESLRVLTYLNDSLPQYDIEMQLLNTRWFLPQNRERLFFVGHLRNGGGRKIFPIGDGDSLHNQPSAISKSAHSIASCLNAKGQSNWTGSFILEEEHSIKIKSATSAGYEVASEGDSINYSVPNSTTRRGRVGKGVAQTLDTQCNQAAFIDRKIRRLTPIECERLQGLPDNWTKYGVFDGKVKEISDSQRYKLCGNGVSIPVIELLGKKLITAYNN